MPVSSIIKQRFQAALKSQVVKAGAIGGAAGLLVLSKLFKEHDTQGNGVLSWAEFCAVLKDCGLTPSPRDIRALFLELDHNADNTISYQEFMSAMR